MWVGYNDDFSTLYWSLNFLQGAGEMLLGGLGPDLEDGIVAINPTET